MTITHKVVNPPPQNPVDLYVHEGFTYDSISGNWYKWNLPFIYMSSISSFTSQNWDTDMEFAYAVNQTLKDGGSIYLIPDLYLCLSHLKDQADLIVNNVNRSSEVALYKGFKSALANIEPVTDEKSFKRQLYYLSDLILMRAKTEYAAINESKYKFKPSEYSISVILQALTNCRSIYLSDDASEGQLYFYDYFNHNKGLYVPQMLNKNYLVQMLSTLGFTLKQITTTLSFIQHHPAFAHRPTSMANQIPCQNGILDIDTGNLTPYSPDVIVLSKLNTCYNPDATNPIIRTPHDDDWDVETWLSEITPSSEMKDLLWQVISYMITRKQGVDQAVFLYNAVGRNGKGTFGELIRSVIGPDKVSGYSIDAFDKPFAIEELPQAYANISDEESVNKFIDDVKEFKKFITKEPVYISRKNRPNITVKLNTPTLHMLNGFPKTKDKSPSLQRRMAFVPFMKEISSDDDRTYIKSDFVKRQDVREYVLLKAIQLYPTFTKLATPLETQQLKEDAALANDSVIEFWYFFQPQMVNRGYSWKFLYELYKTWAKQEGNTSVSAKEFKNRLWQHLKATKLFDSSLNKSPSQKRKLFKTGSDMDCDEPLITEYELKSFYAKNTSSLDPVKLRNYKRPASYEGIRFEDAQVWSEYQKGNLNYEDIFKDDTTIIID